MGGKQAGKRLLLLVYIACCIVTGAALQGCALIQTQDIEIDVLSEAESLMAGGRFGEALAICRRVIERGDSDGRDRAWFIIAMVYAHPENPDRDLNHSATALNRLITDYPRSGLRQQAVVFLNLFAVLRHAQARLEAVRSALGSVERKLKAVKLEKHKLAGALQTARDKVALQERQLRAANETIMKLQGRIEQFKAIDLKTEEKKREVIYKGENGAERYLQEQQP